MGQTTGTEVIKHSITSTTSTNTTHSIVHPMRGGGTFSAAVRFNFGADGDALTLTLSERVPGRSSTASDDDYYEDERWIPVGTSGIKYLVCDPSKPDGSVSGNIIYRGLGDKQHIVKGFFPGGVSEFVVGLTEGGDGTTTRVLAVTTWETVQ